MTEKPALEIERKRAYHREWYQKNKERIRERQRQYARDYYARNKKRIRKKNLQRIEDGYYNEYYRTHKARHLERVQAYRARLSPEQKLRNRIRERERERKAGNRGGAYRSRIARGFTTELIAKLMVLQGNACAICQHPFATTGKRRACADHCHETITPRGLLCFECNIVEGKIRGSGLSVREFSARLHDYLVSPPASRIT